MATLAFLSRRVAQAALVMLIISLIGFSIQDNLGDPLRELVGQSVSEAERDALRETMGLNDPFLTQYWRLLQGAVKGDLGVSYFFKKPALEIILAKFPATFELVLAASLIIVAISVPAGIYCAIPPERWTARLILGGSIVGISIPVFLTAIFATYIFSVELGWVPSFGRGETLRMPWGWRTGFLTRDGLLHLVLPSIALSSIMLPLFIRLIRAEMMEIALLVLMSVLAPVLAPQNPYDPLQIDILDAEIPPLWQHGGDPRFVLGTDPQGRGILSTVMFDTGISFLIGVCAVALQAVVGISFGLLAGYLGGAVDAFLMRLADIQLSLSTLMMAIIALAVFQAAFDGRVRHSQSGERARRHQRRRSPLRGPRAVGASARGDPRHPRQPHQYDLPGPDDDAQSGPHHRRPDGGDAEGASGHLG